MRTLKALTIDFDPVEQSMRDLCRESSDYYFHRTTGKVVVLSKALIQFLVSDNSTDRDALPAWEARMVPVARQIVVTGSTDYIRIPEAFGCPEHVWMAKFNEDIRAPKLKGKLGQALRGRGACRRFKEILRDNPDEARRWTMFRARCWKERIQQWLESSGILAVEENPSKPRATSR